MPRSKPLLIEIGPGLSILTGSPSISYWDNKSRPKNPKVGTIGFNQDTKSLEYWDGKDWLTASME